MALREPHNTLPEGWKYIGREKPTKEPEIHNVKPPKIKTNPELPNKGEGEIPPEETLEEEG